MNTNTARTLLVAVQAIGFLTIALGVGGGAALLLVMEQAALGATAAAGGVIVGSWLAAWAELGKVQIVAAVISSQNNQPR